MPAQSHFDRFLQPIFASRFLTVSALIHLIVIILFGSKVLSSRHAEAPEFQATNDSEVSTDVAPAPPANGRRYAPSGARACTSAFARLIHSAGQSRGSHFHQHGRQHVHDAASGHCASSDQQCVESGDPANQLWGGRFASRCHGCPAWRGTRRRGPEKYGAKPGAGEGVLRALRWLQAQQQTGGAWGTKQSIDGLTGLALLCFLGHGGNAAKLA